MQGIIWFIFIIGLLVGIEYVSKRRKWYKVIKEKPKELVTFTAPEETETVIDKITKIAEKSKYYIVEDISRDRKEGHIIFRKKVSLGIDLFCPIYITGLEKEKTLIEIGVVPTIHLLRSQYATDKAQKECFETIKKIWQ